MLCSLYLIYIFSICFCVLFGFFGFRFMIQTMRTKRRSSRPTWRRRSRSCRGTETRSRHGFSQVRSKTRRLVSVFFIMLLFIFHLCECIVLRSSTCCCLGIINFNCFGLVKFCSCMLRYCNPIILISLVFLSLLYCHFVIFDWYFNYEIVWLRCVFGTSNLKHSSKLRKISCVTYIVLPRTSLYSAWFMHLGK